MKLYVFFWAEASTATDLDWHISCIGMGAAGRPVALLQAVDALFTR
jgi:hypothetical protein